MSRPSFKTISAQEAWDADINDNFNVSANPYPLKEYSGGESALPTAGSFDRCIAMVNEGTEWSPYFSDGTTWRRLSPIQALTGWYYISPGQSLNDAQMVRNEGTGNGFVIDSVLPGRKGSIIGLAARFSAAITGGTLTVKAFKSGIDTGFSLLMDSGGATSLEGSATQAFGTDTFNETDYLDIRVSSSADLNPTNRDLIATMIVQFD